MSDIEVGFGVTCITPPLGKEIPGLFEKRYAEGIHDDLFARAVVVDDRVTTVALAQVDCLFVRGELVESARKFVQRVCGIPPKHCLIAATHTHSGGPVYRGFASENDPEYEAFLIKQIGSAIAEAYRRRQPAAAGVATGKTDGVAFNRRFVMRDGSHQTHPGKMNPGIAHPEGPADPTVTVLGFSCPDTRQPLGCVVNFACHGTHMNGLLYSADYPKWIVETLRAVYGPEFGVVFLNGACGDVTQVDNQSPRPMEFGEYWCRRTGRAVGGEAVKAVATIEADPDTTVDTLSRRISLPIRKSPKETIKAARDYLSGKAKTFGDPVFAKELFEEEAGAEQQAKDAGPDVAAIFARGLLNVEKLRKEKEKLRVEVQAMRIGDALFWTAPGEIFQAFALEAAGRSPFAHTCCVELANGYVGYICTPEGFAGGYESRTARSSLLAPEAGDRIVRTALSLAGKLHDRVAETA